MVNCVLIAGCLHAELTDGQTEIAAWEVIEPQRWRLAPAELTASGELPPWRPPTSGESIGNNGRVPGGNQG
jgi:hypothetical protein